MVRSLRIHQTWHDPFYLSNASQTPGVINSTHRTSAVSFCVERRLREPAYGAETPVSRFRFAEGADRRMDCTHHNTFITKLLKTLQTIY